LRSRSVAVVALFAFNVSVSSSWLNTTLDYTNSAARCIGHKHRRDYTGESSTYSEVRRIGIQHPRRGRGRRTRERWMTGTSTSTSRPINCSRPSPLGAGINCRLLVRIDTSLQSSARYDGARPCRHFNTNSAILHLLSHWQPVKLTKCG
jgi:hypothetical protein